MRPSFALSHEPARNHLSNKKYFILEEKKKTEHFNPKHHHTIQIVAFFLSFYHFIVNVKVKVPDPPLAQEYKHHKLKEVSQ